MPNISKARYVKYCFRLFCDSSGFRTDKHNKLSSFHFRFLQNNALFTQAVGNLPNRLKADGLRIDNFPPPKAHGDFDLIFLIKKLFNLLDLEIQVMLFGLGAELNLFCLNKRLFFLS